jgi:LmbE family N-acetylglucosaminyl deacetylase
MRDYFSEEAPVKVLMVVAHPDDETEASAAIYKIVHELNGVVDQVVITNGEGGYKYTYLAERFYNTRLVAEEEGRRHLPEIRKQELLNVKKILGVRECVFFEQVDKGYGQDVTEPFETWNVRLVEDRLKALMEDNVYDFVFCLLPTEETHAHHKAAAIISLKVAETLTIKPVVLGVSTSAKGDSPEAFSVLSGYPETRIALGEPLFRIDRCVPFGLEGRLNYKVIVNWVIAEHKSQGAVQCMMNQCDYENFWFFDVNGAGGLKKARVLFERLTESVLQV